MNLTNGRLFLHVQYKYNIVDGEGEIIAIYQWKYIYISLSQKYSLISEYLESR